MSGLEGDAPSPLALGPGSAGYLCENVAGRRGGVKSEGGKK